ncbi:MAG: hypothetical protein ACLR2E_06770 [Lachnospiraceae bacterium]
MLESHNDTAVAVAEAISGSTAAFAKAMNEKAKEIGLQGDGILSRRTVLTGRMRREPTRPRAADLARILRYCIQESPKREEFLKITRTGEKTFFNLAGNRSYSCVNHNAFLSMMDGALTGKQALRGKPATVMGGAERWRTYFRHCPSGLRLAEQQDL